MGADSEILKRKEEEMRRLVKISYDLLKGQIEEHHEGKCGCDLRDGGYGLCLAGQWLESMIDSLQVIEDLMGK